MLFLLLCFFVYPKPYLASLRQFVIPEPIAGDYHGLHCAFCSISSATLTGGVGRPEYILLSQSEKQRKSINLSYEYRSEITH